VTTLAQVGDSDFEQEVLQSERPVVVDFWAPWCGPCRVVGPILEDMSAEHGERVRFVALNVDDNRESAGRYQVLSIPTVILFQGGEPKEIVLGAKPRSAYEAALGPWLSAAAS
jgi:thioredoxin 1